MRHISTTFMMSLLVISLAVIFITFSIFSLANAQQQSAGARVAPAIEEGRIDPGDVYTGSIRITNLETAPRTYRVVARDISKTTNAGVPVFAEPGEITGFELSQWITPSVREITLEPGEEREVTYIVSVPESASPGGHFGGIFFFADAEKQRQTGAGVGYQIGTIMNFRISGDIVEDAQIREFLTDKSLYGEAKVSLGVEVENQVMCSFVLVAPLTLLICLEKSCSTAY